jgi:hypothetical protein
MIAARFGKVPTTADFLVQPFLRVVRPDLAPEFARERGERQQVGPDVVEVLGGVTELLGDHVERPGELGFDKRRCRAGRRRCGPGRRLPGLRAIGNAGEPVAHVVELSRNRPWRCATSIVGPVWRSCTRSPNVSRFWRAFERAAEAAGARGRGPAPRPWRGASGRPGDRCERDDRAGWRVRTGKRRQSPACRPAASAGPVAVVSH